MAANGVKIDRSVNKTTFSEIFTILKLFIAHWETLHQLENIAYMYTVRYEHSLKIFNHFIAYNH